MADPNIDKRKQVTLPKSDKDVFVQLVESRPERVFYRINVVDAAGVTDHVVQPNNYTLPYPHDLKRPANAARDCRMICLGTVGFVVAGKWQLECQIIVDGQVIDTVGPGELTGVKGEMNMFRFIADFV